MASILLLEDDNTFSKIINGFLTKHGHDVTLCKSIKEAVSVFSDSISNKQYFDTLLLDYHLPDGNALDFVNHIKTKHTTTNVDLPPAIIMTSFNDIKTAVAALKVGVMDYITKPVHPEVLLQTLKEALELKNTKSTAISKPTVTGKTTDKLFIEGKSEASQQLYKYVQLVGPTDMSVLIQGESGTGKEHIARMIHDSSSRKNKPFVAIDCGALTNDLATSEFFGHKKGAFTGATQDKVGQFEAANGGTLFLDEIGNLSYEVQVKLLRVIQERLVTPVGSTQSVKVDIRLITATNYDLIQGSKKGDFREDLYHRINEFKLYLPPLRERGADLNLFIQHFRNRTNQELRRNVLYFTPELMDVFYKHDWPGNLRELSNVIKRIILLATEETVGIEALPPEMHSSVLAKPTKGSDNSNLKQLQEDHEKEMIKSVLEEVRFNKSKAAKILQIDRKTLYYKIEKYGI